MSKRIFLAAFVVTLAGSAAVLVPGQAAQAPQHPMTFFVAREVPGTGNLGGLAGADQICQNLAQQAGAGNHTWHAYLSVSQAGNEPAENARNRIGPGPWYNAKGVLIASNVADLHGDFQRDRNSIRKSTALDEHGMEINGYGDMPNEHDMLTGSDSDGRALYGVDATCDNWTSDGMDHKAMLGHSDRNGPGAVNTSWNSAHISRNCTKEGLIATGGAGHFYCFAIN
jgi:hypothetical protein